MNWFILLGIILTLLGLTGLAYIILRAFQARRKGLHGVEMQAVLKKLLPLNVGALLVSTLGLMCVIVGIFL